MNKFCEYGLIGCVAVILLWLYPMWMLSAFRDELRKDCESMGQSRHGEYTIRCEVVKKDGA